MKKSYTHGAGVDEPLAFRDLALNQSYFYNTDGLGSITDITDASGNVVQAYLYDSFGNIVQQAGVIEKFYTYTGREYDEESGLYYYRARYYDPAIGRFLQEDPIGFAGGLNFYSYVLNNPMRFIDPFGLKGNFKENFEYSLETTNDFFFTGKTRVVRTVIGALTASTVARETGLRTAGAAIKEYFYNARMYAPGLEMAGAAAVMRLAAPVLANSAVNASAVFVSLKTGIAIGSFIDAAIQTYLIDEKRDDFWESCK